ncbi:MAG: helix-turn-helix domain-containing protein [Xenococcus sp. MO_188.B8]|nr:helix-turn-helix domain-containing protein [Xenococcus sp. MO_188.B8]
MVTTNQLNKPYIPSESEISLSQESSRILASHLKPSSSTQTLKVIEENGQEQILEIPSTAYQLLIDILSQMAQGNAVTLIPMNTELTTQEAVGLLNVSRPYLIKLLESNKIPFRKVGRHRRIRFEDVMNYKNQIDSDRMQALDELAAQAQELDMGYE